MLTGVTVTCFVLAYLGTLALELSRWGFRMPYRMAAVLILMSLGWIAHGLYLLDLGAKEIADQGPDALLSTWYDWSLLTAFGLASIYLVLVFRKPETPVGSFLLPLILALIAFSRFVMNQPAFGRDLTTGIWRWTHGVSLMLAMMIVTFGFAIACMYLFQAWRLKKKKRPMSFLRLPSLEYLHSMGRMNLFTSAACFAVGLGSGVIMNLQNRGQVDWLQPGIVFSSALFLWFSVACILQWRLSQRGLGRWTANLNVISFILLSVALYLVAGASHGGAAKDTQPAKQDSQSKNSAAEDLLSSSIESEKNGEPQR